MCIRTRLIIAVDSNLIDALKQAKCYQTRFQLFDLSLKDEKLKRLTVTTFIEIIRLSNTQLKVFLRQIV